MFDWPNGGVHVPIGLKETYILFCALLAGVMSVNVSSGVGQGSSPLTS